MKQNHTVLSLSLLGAHTYRDIKEHEPEKIKLKGHAAKAKRIRREAKNKKGFKRARTADRKENFAKRRNNARKNGQFLPKDETYCVE
jgi:hypothetical protein